MRARRGRRFVVCLITRNGGRKQTFVCGSAFRIPPGTLEGLGVGLPPLLSRCRQCYIRRGDTQGWQSFALSGRLRVPASCVVHTGRDRSRCTARLLTPKCDAPGREHKSIRICARENRCPGNSLLTRNGSQSRCRKNWAGRRTGSVRWGIHLTTTCGHHQHDRRLMFSSDPTLLLTGATGLVGSELVPQLFVRQARSCLSWSSPDS